MILSRLLTRRLAAMRPVTAWSRNRAASALLKQDSFQSPVRPKVHWRSMGTDAGYSFGTLYECKILKRSLELQNSNKWGFVIYRCTYGNEAAWKKAKETLIRETEKDIAESSTPELVDSLVWTFMEDATTLDGARPPELRDKFIKWTQKAIDEEQPHRPDKRIPPECHSSRYQYFLHIDNEAMQSILAGGVIWGEQGCPGHVNLVEAHWIPPEEEVLDPDEPDNEWQQFVEPMNNFEPVDGCTTEDVGWVRLPAQYMGIRAFVEFQDCSRVTWYGLYKRPPEPILLQ